MAKEVSSSIFLALYKTNRTQIKTPDATSPMLSTSSSVSSLVHLRTSASLPPTPPDELLSLPLPMLSIDEQQTETFSTSPLPHRFSLSLHYDDDGNPYTRPKQQRAYSEADAPWREAHLAKIAALLKEAQEANGHLKAEEGKKWKECWLEEEEAGRTD